MMPYTEALLDSIAKAKGMNRDEGKTSNVLLLHPKLVRKLEREWQTARRVDTDAAPTIQGLALVEEPACGEDEVCVLSDEDYLEHERMKAERKS